MLSVTTIGAFLTSGQSNLIKGRIAAQHGRLNAFATSCLISWRSVKTLPIYRDFSVFNTAPSKQYLDRFCRFCTAHGSVPIYNGPPLSPSADSFSERSLYAVFRPSVFCLCSVIARAIYSAGWTFQQCFCIIWYLRHPLLSTENFTEIIPEEPLRRGRG